MFGGRRSIGSAGLRPFTLAVVSAITVAACGSGAAPQPSSTSLARASTTASSPEPDTAGPAASVERRAYDLQGHRGARGLRPENTLPGFETALDLMVDTLELDLHYSADGQVIVWHDPLVDPDKCRSAANESVAGMRIVETSAQDLAALICDMNPDPGRFPDQSPTPGQIAGSNWGIVTLDTLFAFVDEYTTAPAKTDAQRANAGRVTFNIETKRVPDSPATIGDDFDGVNPGAFELAILDAVRRHGVADRVILQSFDHRSLWAMASVAPDLRLAALTRRGEVPDFAQLAERGAAIWSPNFSTLDVDLVEAAHEAGLEVVPWTVNEPTEMSRLLDMGVDGIITDRPDLAPLTR